MNNEKLLKNIISSTVTVLKGLAPARSINQSINESDSILFSRLLTLELFSCHHGGGWLAWRRRSCSELGVRRARLWWWGWRWRPEFWWTTLWLRAWPAGWSSAWLSLHRREKMKCWVCLNWADFYQTCQSLIRHSVTDRFLFTDRSIQPTETETALEAWSSVEQSVSVEQGVQVCLVTHLDKGRHRGRLFGENRKQISQRHEHKENSRSCTKIRA